MLQGSGPSRHINKCVATTTILLLFLPLLVIALCFFALWIAASGISFYNSININLQTQAHVDIPSSKDTCPEYFRWIHEDLRPWKVTGITRDAVERLRRTANFRVIIIDDKVYMEMYRKSFQTRDIFTIWGILQLISRYPGKLPDLELMFNCNDHPVIRASDYGKPDMTNIPPPLFGYCGESDKLDIIFPDWSFWGWPEINVKPWDSILREIIEGNKRRKWIDREPYAYWKGNSFISANRVDLRKCNVSDKHDWNLRLYDQNWALETRRGFKESNPAKQCTHRYKIYIDGRAWSVSKKYILACDSTTLYVKSRYYDFFARHLQPLQHYWPIRDEQKCKSIKFAVDWGNNHKQKAQEMGIAASKFMEEELKMDFVYDYMFHLLNGYAKLLKFKPVVAEGAVEVTSESMAHGLKKKFMMESMVKAASVTSPCTMPPPYEPQALADFNRRKVDAMRQVQNWEIQGKFH